MPRFVCCKEISLCSRVFHPLCLGNHPALLHSPAKYAPSIWLVAVSNDTKRKDSIEAIEPNVLPALVLVLLAGLDTKKPASWRVVVFLVRAFGAAEAACAANRSSRDGGWGGGAEGAQTKRSGPCERHCEEWSGYEAVGGGREEVSYCEMVLLLMSCGRLVGWVLAESLQMRRGDMPWQKSWRAVAMYWPDVVAHPRLFRLLALILPRSLIAASSYPELSEGIQISCKSCT